MLHVLVSIWYFQSFYFGHCHMYPMEHNCGSLLFFYFKFIVIYYLYYPFLFFLCFTFVLWTHTVWVLSFFFFYNYLKFINLIIFIKGLIRSMWFTIETFFLLLYTLQSVQKPYFYQVIFIFYCINMNCVEILSWELYFLSLDTKYIFVVVFLKFQSYP